MADTKKKVLIELQLNDQASKSLKSINSSVATLGKTFAVVGAAATALGGVILKNSADYEKLEKTFTVLTGSLNNAKVLLKGIADLSRRSPFEIKELEAQSQMILAYGFSISQVIPMMESLGNVAAGLGDDKLERLVRALGQIQAKGKLAGQEFLQLAETGLPVAEALANKLGVSVETLSRELPNLNIGFETVLETVQELSESRFGGLMEEQANTLSGLWTRIKNEVVISAREIGAFSGALELGKTLANGVLNAVESLKLVVMGAAVFAVKLANGFLKLYNTIKPFLPIITAVVGFFAVFYTLATSLIPAIASLATAVVTLGGALTATTLMVSAIIAAFVVLIGILGYFYIKNIKVNKSLVDMSKLFDSAGSSGTKANNAIADSANAAAESIANIREQIEEENKAYEEQLATIVSDARKRVAENKAAIEKEQQAFEEAMKEKQDAYDEDKASIEQQTADRIAELEGYYSQTEQLDEEGKEARLEKIMEAIEAERLAGEQKIADLQAQFEKEKAEEQASLDERTQTYKEKLDEDLAMLQKHAEEIKTVKEVEAQDEIDILKEKHAERLEALNEQLEKEMSAQSAANDAMVSDLGGSLAEMNDLFSEFSDGIDWNNVLELPSLEKVFLDIAGTVTKGLVGLFYAFISIVTGAIDLYGRYLAKIAEVFGLETLSNNAQKIRDWSSGVKDNSSTMVADMYARIDKSLEAKASGGTSTGGMTLVGEAGPELVNLPRGSHVYNNDETNRMVSSGGITINVNASVTGVDNLKATIIEAVNEATAQQNRLANYNLL